MILLILLITSIADVWIISKFFAVKSKEKETSYLPYLGIIFPNLGIYLSYFFNLSNLAITLLNLFSYLIFLLFINFNFHMTLISRVSSIGMYAIIALLSESICALIFTSKSISDSLFLYLGVPLTILIKFFIVLFINVVSKKELFQRIQLSKNIVLLGQVLSALMLICFIIFSYVVDSESQWIILHGIFILQMIVLNFLIATLYKRMSSEKEKEVKYQKQQQNLEKQKEQLRNAIESQSQLQLMRHDFKNSVLILSSYIEEQKYSKALDFIKSIQQELTEIERKMLESYTPNKELNYLLLHKISYARSQQISIQVECLVPEYLVIDNEVIIAIIGNLLDNAIHACIDLHREELPQIILKLKYYNQSLFMDIKNTIQKDFDLSRIKDGFGIKNIKQIVEKNSGIYRRFLEKDMYCVQIILWDYKGASENE